MNLAITTTSASTWKAVKRHYFIALGGACLALAAVVAGSTLTGVNSGSNAGSPAPAQSSFRISHSIASSPVIIYLVESQTGATDLLASVERDRNESETPRPLFFSFKATTPEEEASVAAFVATWAGRDVHLVDLRNLP